MKIKKLILRNFCQHEYLELNFVEGLNGLYGNNGRGKSNAMMGAYACLTNRFNRHYGHKEGCIRLGSEGESYVELTGEVADRVFILRRRLRGSPASELWLYPIGSSIAEGESITKANIISDWLHTATGLTEQTIGEYMFVPQGDLGSFLTATETERSNMFALLCGTERMAKCREALGRFNREDQAVLSRLEGWDRDAINLNLKESLDNLKKLTASTVKLSRSFKSKPAKLHYQTIISEYELQKRREADYKRYNEALQTAKSELDRLAGLYNDYQKQYTELPDYTERLEELQKFLDFYKEHQRNYVEYQRLYQLAQSATVAKDQSEQLKPDDPPSDSVVEQLESDVATLRSRLERIDKFQQNVMQATSCPHCGSEKQHWRCDDIPVDELVTVYKKLQGSYAKVSEQLSKAKELRKKKAEWQQSYDKAQALFEQTQAACDEQRKKLLPDMACDQLDKAVTDTSNELAEVKSAFQRKNQLHISVQSTYSEYLVQQKAIKTYSESLNELSTLEQRPIDLAQVEEARHELETLEREQQEYAIQIGQIRELEKAIEKYKAMLVEQEKWEAECKRNKEWFTIQKEAEQIFNRDGLPRVVHSHVLQQMSEQVNRELLEFDAPFTLTPNEDLTFNAVFSTGKTINANALSGGETVMAGFALCSAVQQGAAQKLGFMVLDEPLDGLDASNRERAVEVLKRWRDRLKQRGQQVVYITHDPQLEAIFDSYNTID